ncbi:hypothetical protein [Glutamicibacter arilaitensis]|uniref:hypothetical protein n=1 Tax=Glutamicibacter arilaitensis TaxID=256701 RepID=UPI003FD0ABDE
MAVSMNSIICLCHCTQDHANLLGEAIGIRAGKRHLRLEGFAEAYALAHPAEQVTVASELAKCGWNATTAKLHSAEYRQAVDRAWVHSQTIHGEKWPIEVAQAFLDPTQPVPEGLPKAVKNLVCPMPDEGFVVSDKLRLTTYLPWFRSKGALIVHQQDQPCDQATSQDQYIHIGSGNSAKNYLKASEAVLQSLTTKLNS